jgi:CO/xanthine dehydrogenase Mo-binding subunit
MPADRRGTLRLEQAQRAPGQPARRPLADRHGRGGGDPRRAGHQVGRRRAPGCQGRITVETDMTDIGTGSYTIIAQTAAEMLGVGIDKVTVRLGDSRFPEGPAPAASSAPPPAPPASTRPASSCARWWRSASA